MLRNTKLTVLTTQVLRPSRASNQKLIEADIIILATGFTLSVLGAIKFSVDGKIVDFYIKVGYQGIVFTDELNMVQVMGYFLACWISGVDLNGDFVCRLLAHMDQNRSSNTMILREEDTDMQLLA